MNQRKHYTIYNAKDDSIVACGTAEECAAQMGCRVNWIHKLTFLYRRGKPLKYAVIAERMDDYGC